MTAVVIVVALALAAVAAAGILHPFGRRRAVTLERLADPLEEERDGLLRSLRDLEAERDAGDLSEPDYRALRRDVERRAVVVLRSLEARDGAGTLAAGLRDLRTTGTANGQEAGARRRGGARRVVAWLALAAFGAAVLVPALSGAVRDRAGDGPLTGDLAGVSALDFFERRVEANPDDLAARLDLAQRYLDAGDGRRAVDQYLAALRLDPDNPEALSKLGWLLAVSGRPEEGLETVDRAVASDPGYAEARYFRGLILLEALDRPDEAAEAFREYLETAPFGSRREQVQDLLARAEAGGTGQASG